MARNDVKSSNGPGRLPYQKTLEFVVTALSAAGMPVEKSRRAAELIVEADLISYSTHGLARLSQYIDWIKVGLIDPRAEVIRHKRGPALAAVDGGRSLGHLVVDEAVKFAVSLAEEAGCGWVGIRRSNHAGAGGIYVAEIASRNLVGVYGAVSGTNMMAPWGGVEPLLGTNPLAVAIPRKNGSPVVLDMATSTVSFGKIREKAAAGMRVPEGWMIERGSGRSVTDPRHMAKSLLTPVGGHKGSGLAIILGLLAGVVNGADFGRDVPSNGVATNTGQFVLALDARRLWPEFDFMAETSRHMNEFENSTPVSSQDPVRIPGEARIKLRNENISLGIPVSAPLLNELDRLAHDLKIAMIERTP